MKPSAPAIRRQLMQMVLLISGAVLLLTVTALFAYDFVTFRQTSQRQLDTLGRAIAANSTAALAFDNPDDAGTVLAAFEVDPTSPMPPCTGSTARCSPSTPARRAAACQKGCRPRPRVSL